jgi:FkbM family methyltransferase
MRQIEIKCFGRKIPLWRHDFPEDLCDTIEKQGNFLEIEVLAELIPKFIYGQKTILDVGANIGNHTVFFSNFFNYSEIHAFEPIPENYRVLQRNAETLPQVTTHNVALSNYIGTAHLHIPGKNYGGGQFLTEDNISSCLGGKPIINNGDCKVITLDSLNLQNVTFIKMDVEGHEMMVMEGGRETIMRDKPLLFVEDYHNVYDAKMKEYGYECVIHWPKNITKMYAPNIP